MIRLCSYLEAPILVELCHSEFLWVTLHVLVTYKLYGYLMIFWIVGASINQVGLADYWSQSLVDFIMLPRRFLAQTLSS